MRLALQQRLCLQALLADPLEPLLLPEKLAVLVGPLEPLSLAKSAKELVTLAAPAGLLELQSLEELGTLQAAQPPAVMTQRE